MIKSYINMFKNCLDFKSRTSVAEYWYAVLGNIIVTAVAAGISTFVFMGSIAVFKDDGIIYTLVIIFMINFFIFCVHLLPMLALTFRRMHDQDKPGWLAVVVNVFASWTVIGYIVYLVLVSLPGTDGDNQYGKKPIT